MRLVIRRPLLIILLTLALLVPAVRAVADYLGPNRAYTVEVSHQERVRDPDNDQWELTNGDETCIINHPCDEHPSTERQQALCGWVADNSSCTPAYRVETVTTTETRYYPEATVSGTPVCAAAGENGWCPGV
ncbi:MAG: hypothetical protein D6803_07790 [Anaerolineae bacterium]|nr:MAG: hypothetical protein D6803_07790 [Anaerolineae bacterium]